MRCMRWLTAATLIVSVLACKTRSVNESAVRDVDAPNLSTKDTLEYLSQRAADGQWRWDVDPGKFNDDMYGEKIREGKEYFAIPYQEIQACTPDNKVTLEDGSEACLAWDNAFSYDYVKGARGNRFNHIIAQKNGTDQPEIDRFLREGDLIVYFHPETRSPGLDSDGMQWRATHAATIARKKTRDGFKLGTVDTPDGYAQPFTGADTTPFHVFRFMPFGAEELADAAKAELADKYRTMIAKWGTLGFAQFEFASSYDGAAGKLTGPQSVYDTFGKGFLKAATGQNHGDIPDMYCSWFTYTNLNLGWLRPLNTAFLQSEGIDLNSSFSGVDPSFVHNGDAAVSSYIDDDPGLTPHEIYVFEPFATTELLKGMLDRLVGEDDPNLPPPLFCGMAQNKAGLLQGLAGDNWRLDTFKSRDGYVPDFEQGLADEYNQKLPALMNQFAEQYEKMAAEVCVSSSKTVPQAIDHLKALYLEMRDLKVDRYFDVTKRWVPPYIFGYIAENYGRYLDSADTATGNPALTRPWVEAKRPPLAYIGTVIHEKYLKCLDSAACGGGGGGGGGNSYVPATVAEPDDEAADEQMYQIVGERPRGDGNGYQVFFDCLAGTRQNCGQLPQELKFSPAEVEGLVVMAKSWHNGATITERQANDRNTYGLDPVKFRRMLISYWNNPMDAFRPNMMEDPSRNLKQNVINFRILFTGPAAMLPQHGDLQVFGQGKRQTVIPCMRGAPAVPNQFSCDATLVGGTAQVAVNDPPYASYGPWLATLGQGPGGSNGNTPATQTCRRINANGSVKEHAVTYETIVNGKLKLESLNRGERALVATKLDVENLPQGFSASLNNVFPRQVFKITRRDRPPVVTTKKTTRDYIYTVTLTFSGGPGGNAPTAKVKVGRKPTRANTTGRAHNITEDLTCDPFPFSDYE